MMETTPGQQTKKGRGCFFYGCITVIVLMLLIGVMAILGIRYVRSLVYSYTDTSPMVFPKVEMSEADVTQLKERVAQFRDAAETGTQAVTLVLTGNEINALLANDAEMSQLKGRFYVSIDDDQVKGQVSIPLGEIWLPFVKGRYLNGSAGFKVSLANSELVVTVQSITVKGKPLPEKFMADFRQQNLARDFSARPENADVIRKLESIQITNGVVRIVVRERQ